MIYFLRLCYYCSNHLLFNVDVDVQMKSTIVGAGVGVFAALAWLVAQFMSF